MNIKAIMKSKKAKNILFTILEIVLVAGLIFGVLMFIYHKMNTETRYENQDKEISTDSKDSSLTGDYYIKVNRAKNVVIVYEYSDKKHTDKKAVKVFLSSIGKDLKTGTYKTKKDYTWVYNDGYWHQYNTKLKDGIRIQSVSYKAQYPNTLFKKSYHTIGKKIKGSSIQLYSGDAKWISSHCKTSTSVKVIKGKKTDTLPMTPNEKIEPYKSCLWDPTDPSGDNPYAKIAPGSVVLGSRVVSVEKGEKISYLGNILALDESGGDITSNLTYKKFSSEKLGKHTVPYSYKSKNGISYSIKQEFKVIDTTPPKVSCSRTLFTYQVLSRAEQDMNKDSNVKAIEAMVRPYVSCNESGCSITVKTVRKEELDVGRHSVIITAKDTSGNVGSCQVLVDVSLKDNSVGGSKKFTDKEKESLKKAAKNKGKEEQTKKETN